MKRYEDAMDSFNRALEFAETDEEKYDTLSQIITIGSEVEGMLHTMLNINEEENYVVFSYSIGSHVKLTECCHLYCKVKANANY